MQSKMSNQSEFNVWSKWDPLKEVLLGSMTNNDYFEHVRNIEIREKLTKILVETNEDIQNMRKVLQQFGVTVRQWPQDPNLRLDPDTKAPLQDRLQLTPRDIVGAYGRNILFNNLWAAQQTIGSVFDKSLYNRKTAWHDLLMKRKINVIPASWTLVGDCLFVDQYKMSEHSDEFTIVNDAVKKNFDEWRETWLPEVKHVKWLDVGAHLDGCFHTCKPGVILSLKDIQTYSETFPNWDVLYLDENNWHSIQPWRSARWKTAGKYWIPGEEQNNELLDFVNLWLDEWLGFVEETVFDVNILMINDQTALVTNHNKKVFDYFKKHNIEPIIIPNRHRFFFDGGLHCLTADTFRQGDCQSYV